MGTLALAHTHTHVQCSHLPKVSFQCESKKKKNIKEIKIWKIEAELENLVRWH